MKVIVTGGAGFIGSHVVGELIKNQYEVTILDNFSSGKLENIEEFGSKVNVICINISNSEVINVIKDIQPTYIIHLAAQPSVAVSQKQPVLDAESNVKGMVNVLEGGRLSYCKKIVFAASGGTIYGDVSPNLLPLHEDLPWGACSFYGLTKLTGVQYLKMYKEHFGLNYCALALGNIYGPKQDPHGESGVIAIFTKKIAMGQLCTINGDGKVTRDYVYVQDAAIAFVKALEKGTGLINLGTCKETSVNEVHQSIINVFNETIKPIHGPPLPGEVQRVALSNKKLSDTFDWTPETSFQVGIEKTVEWFLENRMAYA